MRSCNTHTHASPQRTCALIVMTAISATKVGHAHQRRIVQRENTPAHSLTQNTYDLMGMRTHGDDAHVGHEGAHAHKRRIVQREHAPAIELAHACRRHRSAVVTGGTSASTCASLSVLQAALSVHELLTVLQWMLLRTCSSAHTVLHSYFFSA